MARNNNSRRNSKAAGLPPGTLIYVGERRAEEATIKIIDYDEERISERGIATADECREYLNKSTVTWINFIGIHDTELLQQFGDVFSIHPLVLEDIANTAQRPKMEDHGDYIFMVLKMLYRPPDSNEVVAEQVSIILGKNYVLTFQEVEGDVFDIIRDRLRTAKGRIRKMGCDYLAYSLLDSIVDNYFVVLEQAGDMQEKLQEDVTSGATQDTVERIHKTKRELIFIRKSLWPVRELVSNMEKSESDLIDESLTPYLRDVYEHTIQVIDNVESLRDTVSGTLDIYMTIVSNRMNEVMKVLTIIATIFIPLTFIAGIYGMNFEYMPELKWRLGYAGVWVTMLLVAACMVFYFRIKKWL